MKHTLFLIALLALLSAIGAAAQSDEDLRSSEGAHDELTQCWQEEEKGQQAIDACKAYLMKQCTASSSTMLTSWPWKWRMVAACRALKQRCCDQLEQVPQTCRCQAIRVAVQEMQQGGEGGSHQHQQNQRKKMMSSNMVRQSAKTLPSVCNLYPSYCNIPTADEVCYC